MKLVMTLLARDEEDIVRKNIEYHLNQGVDFIVATDNLSTDGTRDIMLEYQNLGVLSYRFESGADKAQYKWVTDMARLAYSKFNADWIINNDADEFWWPENDVDLKQTLQEIPGSIQGLKVKRFNFPPRPNFSRENFLHTMVYRELRSTNALGKPLPPKVLHRAASDIVVEQGNHKVWSRDRELAISTTDSISVFHFPIRTLPQFKHKVEVTGRAYARSSLPPNVGGAQRNLYQILKTEGLEGYFTENLLDDLRLEEALREWIVVEDRRLSQFFLSRNLTSA